MGKITLKLTPIFGIGFMKFNNFVGSGQVESDDGKTATIEYNKWDPDVNVQIKKAFMEEFSIPSDLRLTIEWKDTNQK